MMQGTNATTGNDRIVRQFTASSELAYNIFKPMHKQVFKLIQPLPFVLPLLLAACATSNSIEQTRRELDAARQQTSARLSEVEARLSNERLLDLVKEVASLRTEMAALRGQNEVLQHQQGEMLKRQNDLYADLDLRLGKLEQAASSPAASGEADAAATPAAPQVSLAQDALNKALATLRNREFARAVPELKAVMDKFPANSEAQEASYWLGVAHTYLKQYDAAIDIQRRFAEQYPKNPRAPDALRLMADNQIALQQKDQARSTLQRLIKLYPASSAAQKAKQRLGSL